jgi:hypothetical protein
MVRTASARKNGLALSLASYIIQNEYLSETVNSKNGFVSTSLSIVDYV